MMLSNVPPHRLAFPHDLPAWRAWQQSAHPLRRATDRARAVLRARSAAGGAATRSLRLTWRGENPAVLLALDGTTPTQLASVLEPLRHLQEMDVAVLSAGDVTELVAQYGGGPDSWRTAPAPEGGELPAALAGLRAVVATGNYLPAGSGAHEWSQQTGSTFTVIQHGLLTPFAPPLPDDCLLLAFSEQDAQFYTWRRSDVRAQVIGSQLLWSAARPDRRAAATGAAHRPVFLGQLHGAELPRQNAARAARQFCACTGALYRPHPGETDKLSRAQHAAWRARGLTVEEPGSPLVALDAPVVSVFSTGVLEAAARGLPARVTHPAPPRWLEAFWERYSMARWNGAPDGAGAASAAAPATPPPVVPAEEPARAVARIARELAGGVVAPPAGEAP